MKERYGQYFPWVVVGLGVIYFLVVGLSPGFPKAPMDLAGFASLPVVENGRVKPYDTVARTSLMVISGKQNFTDESDRAQPSIKWLLEVMAAGPNTDQYKVFRIENDQVLALLDLKQRRGLRYSIEEFRPKVKEFLAEVERIKETNTKDWKLYENKVMELDGHLKVYLRLAQGTSPLAVPPLNPGQDWQPLVVGLEQKEKVAQVVQAMLHAYQQDNSDLFNDVVAAFHKALQERMPTDMARARFEVFFNQFAPFYHCAVLYGFVFILACGGWLGWSTPMNRAAFWLAALTLAVHSWALIARMYLQGRPPVTNLYSSAIFIGWGCVFLGLFLEWLFRNGIGNVTAATTGGLSLIIAHYLGTSGDTLEMMRAVLDTNFWLATHVTCITMGYTATFLAGFIGIFFVLAGVFSRKLTRDSVAAVAKMIYGVICFAMLLSFTGTVLGGIWADQSWGRFWGWDPKENGALMIVLWNALVLHARWSGMIKQRGLAVLAIGGNIVTSWSWFGVNMLGVGLHSYGFIPGAVLALGGFVFTQLSLMGLGVLPMKYWRSFAPPGPKDPPKATSFPKARDGRVLATPS